ncbi:MAG: hypothetical protein IK052_01830 [Bacteroidales bacterium]|nr:hypothetical protein [Bacteroidales bacterium]
MKKLIITLLLALAGAGAINASTMSDGHTLTALWAKYDEAAKADLPQKEASILAQIKKEAMEKRLPVDFWDAATKYVYAAERRDWKQREPLREALAKEVEEFDCPIVTFLWMDEWKGVGQEELWAFLQKNPLEGNNPALHRGMGSFLGGALVEFVESDEEWAHWRLLNGRYSEPVVEALEKLVAGKYPQEGALKYYLLGRKYNTTAERAEKRKALKELQDAYPGTAFALFPEGDILEREMWELDESKEAKSAEFKALYDKCKDFEARRAAFKGTEKTIAQKYTSTQALSERLTSKDLDLRIDKEAVTILFRNLSSATVKLYNGKTVVTTWNAQNPTCSFYVRDTLRLALPALPDGIYRAEAVNGKISAMETYEQFTLSIATRTDAEGRKVYVADYDSGKPLSKVQLILKKGDTEVANSTVKLDGFTKLPAAVNKVIDSHPKTYYTLVAVSGDRRSRGVSINREPATYKAATDVCCNIYRDRGAYNPGDTMQFKLVLFKGDPMLKMQVCSGKKLEVKLYDSEHNHLESLQVKTNEWGSASGAFKLPEGLRNGMFSIEIKEGSKSLDWDYFRVDEFVLPTFDLTFDTRKELYMVGSKVPVSGKVTSYSGHGLSGATARINVDLWGDENVFEKEITLASDGIFSFEVPANEEGYYHAEVTITDTTGETLSFTDSFYVGDELEVEISVQGTEDAEFVLPGETGRYWRWRQESTRVVRGSEIRAKFQAKDSEGNPVPLDVTYYLGEEKIGSAPSGQEVAIPVSKSGLYTVKGAVKVTLENGKVVEDSTETKVLVLLPGEKNLNVEGSRLFIGGPSTVDNRIEAVIGSADGDAWAIATVYGKDSEVLETTRFTAKDGKLQNIGITYSESWPDAVRLQVFYFIHGKAVQYNRQYRRSRTKLTLPLSFTSFQDKAYPGREYTFTLKTEPGVEALAAAWDKSMDAIAVNYWPLVDQRDYSVPQVNVLSVCGSVGNTYNDDVVIAYGTKTVAMARNKSVMFDAAPAMAVMEESAEYELADDAADDEIGGIPEDIPIRSEFLQALTFQPHLVPDKDGNLSFSLRTSDKLSTYYVRVYAHSPSMKNAIVEGEMLVTIPVKVAIEEPRFLYEGDVWNAAVTVSSVADAPVSGVVALQWEGGSAQVPVTVPAGETVTKVFPVVIPSDPSCHSERSEESFTAAFIAADFSDAVRVTVPVYPAAQTLTEAHSAVLHAGEDREALLSELRSRFVNVPGSAALLKEITVLDMVKDAIPSHVEPSGTDVLSLSEAWYVQLMASRLGESTVIPSEASVSPEDLLPKILSCRNSDGGFGWFEGMKSSAIITAVVLERFAKLRDRGFEVPDLTSSVKYLDANQFGDVKPYWCGWLSDAQYMHVRALYASVPFTEKAATKSEKDRFTQFKKDAKSYLTPSAKEGRGLQGQILSKARRLLTLKNLLEKDGGIALAKAWGISLASAKMKKSLKADVTSLLEYAVEHRDGGWYYPNAVMPWRGLLESEAYAHALLCDLLSSVIPSTASVSPSLVADGIRLWLMLQKETQKWDTDPAFIDAITSILDGSKAVLDTKVLALSATYNAPFKDIKAAGNGFTVERHFFVSSLSSRAQSRDLSETEIQPGDPVKVGDKIRIVYKIWNGENRSFVKVTAGREASLNPVEQLSGHIGYGFIRPLRSGFVWGFVPQGYRNVKASATEYYFDSYPEENTELSEEFFVTRAGTFQAPSVVIESLYASHYRANSAAREPLVSVQR